MKKTFTLLAVFAIALCASCSKDQEIETEDKIVPGEEQIGEGVTQFTASIPETKTYLDGPHGEAPHRTWNNFWSVGDAVNVNGVNSKGLEDGSEYIGSDSAVFEMDPPVSGDYYYAVYPSSAVPVDGYNSSTHVHTVNIGATQNFVVDSYDPAAYLMTVKSDTPRLTLNPMMGLIQLTTKGPTPETPLYIQSISVESVGDEKLTGSFTTNADHTAITGGSGKQITISAPAGTTKPFGTVFTFAVPAQNYASGIRFRITATTDDKGTEGEQTMVFAKQSAFDVTAGTLYPLTAPAFKESNITLDCTFKTSSSAGFEWSAANASNNVKKVWRLAIYSNSACTDSYLVVQHDIPADESPGGIWKDQGGTPRFIVGGLNQGTNYWCKVTDLANGVFKVVEFTTDAFTPVSASSPSGSTLVAEDFSEIGWGSAFLGGYAEHRYAGWSPVDAASAQNKISFDAPSGVVTEGYYKNYDFAVNNLHSNFDYTSAPRLSDGWGWFSEGGFNGYPQPGFLRMGGKNANRSFVVTPALAITAEKYATVKVTVVISHMNAGDASGNPDFGVFKETDLTLSNETQRTYSYTGTESALQHAYPLASSKYGSDKDELIFTVKGVKNSDHLVLGAYKNVNEKNRYNLYSVKIEREGEEYDDEIFDITDAASLALFHSRVAGDATSLKGNVINNVDASTIASSWESIAGYTGTLEGNSKTITGLTQPFFADLQGTVRNLTLDSTINWEDDVEGSEGPAIFAQSLSDGGSLDYCTSLGSVRYCPSTAVTNSTRYVGGLVGYVPNGSVTYCSNEATISFPHNSQTNDMVVCVGGLIGGIEGSSICSDNSNSGDVSAAIIGSTSTTRHASVGGVVGRVDDRISGDYVSNLTNSGHVLYSGSATGQVRVGGVVGFSASNISGCTNSQEVRYEGKCEDVAYVGGVVGYNYGGPSGTVTISNTSNNGSVIVNSSIQEDKEFMVGGVAGRSNGTITATNSGIVSISELDCTQLTLGGIVGLAADGGIGSGSSNISTGDITISNLDASGCTYIGGVAGRCYSTGEIKATNGGDITINSNCAANNSIYIGGIVGHSSRPIKNCTNNGNISNAMRMTKNDKEIKIGGISGHNTSNGSISNCHNTGSVGNTANSANYLFIGGISGESAGTISDSDNIGNVTNSGDAGNGKPIVMGGVSGKTDANVSSSSNGTSSASGGTISNSGTAAEDICIGGVSGINMGYTFTSCYNNGSVSNAGNPANECVISIGGLVGLSKSNSTYNTVCYNTGAISNTGISDYDDAPGVSMGGLIGCATGLHSVSGSSFYNNGAVEENSSSTEVAVGGVCGFYLDADGQEGTTSFAETQNRSYGTLTVKGNTRKNISIGGIVGFANNNATLTCASNAGNIYVQNITGSNCINVGGILGLAATTPSISGTDSSNRTSNSGNIEFTSCTNGGALRVGGVLGWWDNSTTATLEYCSNTGTISTHTKTTSSTDLNITHEGFNYVGGIVGGSVASSDQTNKTIRNCINTNGHITIYSKGKFRIGGIAAYTTKDPSNCTCTANITYARDTYATTSDRSCIGGIVGYQIKGNRNFVNLHYNGSIETSGSYCYASSIIGYTGYNSTFDNCSIQGSVQCLDKKPGLFFSDNTASGKQYSITCKNGCTVKKGTRVISSSGTTTINSIDDITNKNVVGGGGTTSTLPIANLSVVD